VFFGKINYYLEFQNFANQPFLVLKLVFNKKKTEKTSCNHCRSHASSKQQATNNKRINKMKERRKEKIVSSSTQSIAF
jgi:hypothetical protein